MTLCLHGAGSVCWLCSNQVSWWHDARVKAGLGFLPPNRPSAAAAPYVHPSHAWRERIGVAP